MPNNNRKRGTRGKRSEKHKQHTQLLSRSAEADQSRLQKAIKRSTELNQLSGASSSDYPPADLQEQPRTEASGFTAPPADQQEKPQTGVTWVSIESDSDHLFSPSAEGSNADTKPVSTAVPPTVIACSEHTVHKRPIRAAGS